MKTLFLLIAALLISANAYSQDKITQMLNLYDNMQMNKTQAMITALIIPGGGALHNIKQQD